MDCPACNERVIGPVRFCRNCGIQLVDEQSESTAVLTKKLDQPPPFFPVIGTPVVPISTAVFRVSPRENLPITNVSSLLNIPDINGFPEEALAFTIDSATLEAGVDKILQPRGLLQIKESYKHDEGLHEVKVNHIDLFFARAENTVMSCADENFHTRKADSRHERIRLDAIESVAYKRSLRRSSLVITLSPSSWYCDFLKVDHVMRQVVLQISRKEAVLAKRMTSAVNLDVSKRKLEAALEPKSR
jgi:hypothetical protein